MVEINEAAMMKYIPFLPACPSERTVIVANGQFPLHEVALQMLHECRAVVCCDGAIEELLIHGIVPQAIVGDCDSLSPQRRREYADIIHEDKNQQTNDLTKAVEYCVTKGAEAITILGATGKREDHTLGNISLLAHYGFEMGSELDVVMVSDYGVFAPARNQTEFESFCGQQVSVFGVDGVTLVTYDGLLYPLTDEPLKWWWQGTLNESLGERFRILADGKVVVFRAFADAT